MKIPPTGLARTILFALLATGHARAEPPRAEIVPIDPPQDGFYAKMLAYEGIPVKASKEVADEALWAARGRLELLMKNLPNVRFNMQMAGAELHLIGKDQVTSDLPEHRAMKGKPFEGKMTIDERTRGLGGLMTSCGEENLLHLKGDRYWDRDICLHEFSHNIYSHGAGNAFRTRWQNQRRQSLDKGLWVGSYAGSNDDEFFAELTMWYFGTRGDHGMRGPKPGDGPEGLRAYDPDAFALMDDFYAGRIDVPRIAVTRLEPVARDRWPGARSVQSREESTVIFVNRTARNCRLCWIDFEGRREPRGTLPAHGRETETTYLTHPWAVENEKGETLALFLPEKGRCLAILE